MKVICISGTPGTGKTTISKRLAKLKNYERLDVAKLIKEKKLEEGYDKKKKCKIIDIKILNKEIIKIIKNTKKSIIIDSHLSHYLPKKHINLCIITKCDLKKLKKRLEKKGYTKAKVRENLDCEIFDICLNEAKESKLKIKILDTTNKLEDKYLKALRI